jgi:hypothetical protein
MTQLLRPAADNGGSMNHEDDREKLSWRELDARRDRSAQRPVSPAAGRPAQPESQAYRAYKSQLGRLFDGGALPGALQSKLAHAGISDDSKQRRAAGDTVVAAEGEAASLAALAAYCASFGMPDDERVLAKLLDLTDTATLTRTLQHLTSLVRTGALKHSATLRGRVKGLQMATGDDDVWALCRDLLAKL